MGPPRREFRYRWRWILPAPPEALWPLVSDTNRFNRDAGLPPVEDVRAPGERLPNARRRLRLRVKGVVLEWEELPFEWLRPCRFGQVRRYSRGPLLEMRILAELEPTADGGTALSYQVVARPRGLLGLVSVPIQIGFLSRHLFGRTFRRYAMEAAAAPPVHSAPTGAPGTGRVWALRRPLLDGGVPEPIADKLLAHVAHADDMSLSRIRPYELADLWDEDRRAVLSACMRATRAGLLDLRWDILCPGCRGVADGADTLRHLRTGVAHCETCLIEFSPDFDQSVEVTFRPTEAVRQVRTPPFCVAGPQVTPHVAVQQLLAPGESRDLSAALENGRHRARAFGVEGGPSFRVEPGGADFATLRVTADGWACDAEALAPTARLRLVNDTADERLFDVERTAWGDTASTAAEVTALSEFRDLFSSEVLAVGAFVRVGSLAVLFTDLKGSTSLYRRIGDAAAFGRVMRHFDVIRECVVSEEGAVVKTIGDAVMAVFRAPDHALRAALEAHRRLAAAGADPLVLKAGIHYGPCISVTLNDRLDYFGTTVNIAARLGSLSSGNDIVVSDGVRRDPGIDQVLRASGASLSSLHADIRGLEDKLLTWRMTFPEFGRLARP